LFIFPEKIKGEKLASKLERNISILYGPENSDTISIIIIIIFFQFVSDRARRLLQGIVLGW